jgi:hypothetical protein
MISDRVGVHQQDGLVQYIVNGLPVYSHSKENLKAFRYITSVFISQGLCRKVEVKRCFSVSEDSVHRYFLKYKELGEEAFFGVDARRGSCHKIVGERRERIQKKLDLGQSVLSIAKQEGVQEGAIRYQIKMGYLKKKNPGV